MKSENEDIQNQMTVQEADILSELARRPFVNQRKLSGDTGYSLGAVNRSILSLKNAGYLDGEGRLTDKAHREIAANAPRNAIILAAGPGMRMIPINQSTPKAFLEIHGERLIDRLIRQLHEAGIAEITVVVGFLKEQFEYLIDDEHVTLVVNEAYSEKNNLHSLKRVLDRLGNTYILPCDLWFENNPFRHQELYSWYMVSDEPDLESAVRVNRKSELVAVGVNDPGNRMIGVSYLLPSEADSVKRNILRLALDRRHDDAFWEEALYEQDRMFVHARVMPGNAAVEVNTYEQLRDLDSGSDQLKSDAIGTIAAQFGVPEEKIENISILKKGMTNRSFLFTVSGRKYIMRIPGEGTGKLINRRHEADVYQAIRGYGLCDVPVYINPDNGYKITAYLDAVRACDPQDPDDLRRCMETLRRFHRMNITVAHAVDLFGQIVFYESLWEHPESIYRDYGKTKSSVLRLKALIDTLPKTVCLTHIDAVPDNFLFYEKDGGEALQLTDWEYAGMQDPHVDLAMFCIYSLYDKEDIDRLIDLYFENRCDDLTRMKIYGYIAACGLLWSNWCEYKRQLGIEFGEYSLRQYRYAKDYFRCTEEAAGKLGIKIPPGA